jgi:hypothetical protein
MFSGVRWRSPGFVLFAGVVTCGCASMVQGADPVLTIWVKPQTGKTGTGIGFMINESGQILTCYHVIRGASELTVYQDKAVYKELQVVAIAPDYDLAILQIANFPPPAPHLRLSKTPPRQYFDEQLKIRGSPNALGPGEFDAKTNYRDYVRSGRPMAHRHHCEAGALSGSIPIRSLTEMRNFCLQPRYRSVAWIETWPSRNWI